MESSAHYRSFSSPSRGDHPPNVDFTYRNKSGQWQPLETLHEKTRSILEAVESYLDVVNNNGSIAKLQGTTLYHDRIEARINQSFTCSRPPIEQAEGNRETHSAPLDWVDLVDTDIAKLNPSSDGKYRYKFGDLSVVISREDRDTLCSSFIQKLLNTKEPEDVADEEDARARAAVDLINILADIDQTSTVIQKTLIPLFDRYNDKIKEHTLSSTSSENQAHGRQISTSYHRSGNMPINVNINAEDTEPTESPSSRSVTELVDIPSREEVLQISETPSSNKRACKRRSNGERWSDREEKSLLDYFQAQHGLSLQEMSDGYRQFYGSHRSLHSIKKKAIRMRLDPSNHPKKRKIVKIKAPSLSNLKSGKIAMQELIAPNSSPGHENLASKPPSEAPFRNSPTLRGASEQSQPADATLNSLNDQEGRTSKSPQLSVHEIANRGRLSQLLN